MSYLTGKPIATSYDQILITDNDSGITGTTTTSTQIICGTGVAGIGNTLTTPLHLSRDWVGIGAIPVELLTVESPTMDADGEANANKCILAIVDGSDATGTNQCDARLKFGRTLNSDERFQSIGMHAGDNDMHIELDILNGGNSGLSVDVYGTDVFHILNDGNVGIGTDTPVSLLTISTTLDATDDADQDKFALMIQHPVSTNNFEVGIGFNISADQAASANPGAAITHERKGSDSVGSLHFKTSPSDTNLDTRMTIDKDGKVGIGTTAPLCAVGGLHIDSSTAFSLTASTGDTLFLSDDTITSGTGSVGASIGFSGSQAVQRQAAIAALRTGGDHDEIGLAFYTHPSTTDNETIEQKMVIDHDGNVGIGTAAPGYKLEIDLDGGERVKCTGGSSKPDLHITNNSGTSSGDYTIDLQGTNYASNFLQIGRDDGGHDIALTGKVGIGTAAPNADLQIVSSDSDSYRGLLIRSDDSACDSNNILVDLDYSNDVDVNGALFIHFQDSEGGIGAITGNADGVNYAESSDYRRKTDFKNIVDATGTINQLKLYDFAWKSNTNKRSMGVIAHEAQAIVPTAITGEKDAMTTKEYIDENGVAKIKDVIKPQMADYSKFVPLLLKSIQELSAKVTALENA